MAGSLINPYVGLVGSLINPSVGLDVSCCVEIVSNLWLDSPINPSMRWLDCLQSDKPICWLDWSLKVNVGLVECHCTLAMYESVSVPLFLEETMPSSRVVVSPRD